MKNLLLLDKIDLDSVGTDMVKLIEEEAELVAAFAWAFVLEKSFLNFRFL